MRLNPDWEFKLWTDEENLQLVEMHYPELLDLYKGYNQKIKQIDMVRILYLHKFGGVYMDLDIACLRPFGSVFDLYPNRFVVVNQFREKREYANAIMASPPRLDRVFNIIFDKLPLNRDKDVLIATGGKLFQYDVLSQSSVKGMWVEMPFELFYAQEWTQGLPGKGYDICNSFDNCRERYPNAITLSMWTGTWTVKEENGLERHWHHSNNLTMPLNIGDNYNYVLPSELKDKVFLSGFTDKGFCLECIWRNGVPCHKRMDYLIEKYHLSRKEAMESLMIMKECKEGNHL